MRRCYYCGDLCDTDEIALTTSDVVCCIMCADDFPMCATCGRIITDKEDHYEEETGNHYCKNCY